MLYAVTREASPGRGKGGGATGLNFMLTAASIERFFYAIVSIRHFFCEAIYTGRFLCETISVGRFFCETVSSRHSSSAKTLMFDGDYLQDHFYWMIPLRNRCFGQLPCETLSIGQFLCETDYTERFLCEAASIGRFFRETISIGRFLCKTGFIGRLGGGGRPARDSNKTNRPTGPNIVYLCMYSGVFLLSSPSCCC